MSRNQAPGFWPLRSIPWRLLLAGLAALTITACNRAPHASPTALRNTNDYAKVMALPAPGALDIEALDRFTVTQEVGAVVVTSPPRPTVEDPSDGFAHTVDRLKPGQALEGAGARFELVAFAVSGPGISKTPTNADGRVPLDYFGPDGTRLSAEKLKSLGFKKWDLAEYSSGPYGTMDDAFPKLQIRLGSRAQPPGYYSPVGLFDARTKHSLSGGGYSYGQISSDSLGNLRVHSRAWHLTPMDLVVDVELDGKTVVETEIGPGKRVTLPGGQVQWLGTWDGSEYSWSSQGGNPTVYRVSLRQQADETNAVALFVTEPPRLAVHVELLNARGKVLEPHGGGSSGAVRMAGLRGRAAEVARARFTVYTNHHRVVVPLPPIPNLPAENQHVENLFEARLPQVQIRDEYELRELIGRVTQLDFVSHVGAELMPKNLFPLTLTNTTPAQLLEMYCRQSTNGCLVVVDEQKQEIRLELSRFEQVRRWLKQKLGW